MFTGFIAIRNLVFNDAIPPVLFPGSENIVRSVRGVAPAPCSHVCSVGLFPLHCGQSRQNPGELTILLLYTI